MEKEQLTKLRQLLTRFKQAYNQNPSDDGFYAARMMLYVAVAIMNLCDPEPINDVVPRDMKFTVDTLIDKICPE